MTNKFELWETPLIDPAQNGHGILIEASAGTGKTFSIERIVVRLLCDIAEPSFTPQKLLVVTFTKAATAELNRRLKATLSSAYDHLSKALEILEGANKNASLDNETDAVTRALNALGEFKFFKNTEEVSLERMTKIHQRASEALRQFDQATITTIHGFCQRMLERHPLSGLTPTQVECIDRDDELREQAVYAAKTARLSSTKPLTEACRKAIFNQPLEGLLAEVMRHPEIDDTQLTTLPEGLEIANQDVALEIAQVLADARRRLIEAKKAAGVRTQNDLLFEMREAVKKPAFAAAVREAYRAVLIDEFQDTDQCQFEIFDTLFMSGVDQANDHEHRSLVFVGDPKQAIYRFRGADIEAYRRAKKAVAHTYQLNKNWRTTKKLIDILNTIFKPCGTQIGTEDRFTLERYTDVEAADVSETHAYPLRNQDGTEQSVLTIQIGNEKWKQDDRIQSMKADILKRLANDQIKTKEGLRALKPSDIAILVHKNADIQAINDCFGRDLLTTGSQKVSIYATQAARDTLSLLHALAQPHNEKRFIAAMTCLLTGMCLAELVPDPKNPKAAYNKRTQGRLLLQTFMQQLESDGFLFAFERFLDNRDYVTRMRSDAHGQLNLSALRVISQRLDADWRRTHSIEVMAAHLSAAMNETDGDEPKEEDLVPPFDEGDAVTVLTMHKSKGLEFPVVYIPFIDRQFYQCKINSIPLKLLIEKHPEQIARWLGTTLTEADLDDNIREVMHQENRDTLEEAMRLLYVAMTRAKCKLILGLSPSNDKNSTPWHAFFSESMTPVESSSTLWTQKSDQKGTETPEARYATKVTRLLEDASNAPEVVLLTTSNTVDDISSSLDIKPSAEVTLATIRADEGLSVPRGQTTFRTSFTKITQLISKGPRSKVAEPPLATREDDEALDEADDLTEAMNAPTVQTTQGFAYPFGKKAGEALHASLEAIDFGTLTVLPPFKHLGDSIEALADQNLQIHCPTLSSDDRQKAVDWFVDMVKTLVNLPIPDRQGRLMSLAQVTPQARRSEMDFVIQLPANLTAVKLNAALAGYRDEYAFMTDEQSFDLAGYLSGSIDLVFAQNDQWWIVDWKSNKIGLTPNDPVTHEMVKKAVQSHRYTLQYILYLLAFRRFLKLRYVKAGLTEEAALDAIDQSMGGVFYIFVRWLKTNTPNKCPAGLYQDRPSATFLRALERLTQGDETLLSMSTHELRAYFNEIRLKEIQA